MPSQAPARQGETAVAPRPAESLREWLQRIAEEDTDRSWEVAASQLDRILAATTLDDIMEADEAGTYQGRDLVGFEFECTGTTFPGDIRVVKSSEKFNAPFGVYIQFHATALVDFPSKGVLAGDDCLISTGSPLVIGKLRTLAANGHLPMKLMFSGTEAPNGVVLKLRRPPNRAIPAKAE